MDCTEIFEKYAQEYDEWFEVNRFAYESEVRALKMFILIVIPRSSAAVGCAGATFDWKHETSQFPAPSL